MRSLLVLLPVMQYQHDYAIVGEQCKPQPIREEVGSIRQFGFHHCLAFKKPRITFVAGAASLTFLQEQAAMCLFNLCNLEEMYMQTTKYKQYGTTHEHNRIECYIFYRYVNNKKLSIYPKKTLEYTSIIKHYIGYITKKYIE